MTLGMDRILLLAALMLGMLSPFASYAPISLGVWSDSEPMGLAFFLSGFLAALGFAFRGDAAPLRHGAVWPFFALGALGLLLSPFAAYPLLSIIGAPQTAQGAAVWVVLGLLIAAALDVRDHRRAAAALVGLGALALIILLALQLSTRTAIFTYNRERLINDWLGFYGLAFPVFAWAWLGRHGLWTKTAMVLAIIISLAALGLSGNLAAFFAAMTGLVAWLLLAKTRIQSLIETPARRWAIGFVIALMPFAVMVMTWLFGSWTATLGSRALLHELLIQSFLDHPIRLALGHGWGHELFLLHTHWSFGLGRMGEGWDILTRDYVGSHNAGLSLLLATGLAGVAIHAAAFAAILRHGALGQRAVLAAYLLAYGILLGFWFELPASLPFFALAVGGCIGPVQESVYAQSRALRPARTVLVLTMAGLFLFTFHQAALFASVRATPSHVCASIPQDAWRGEMGLTRLVRQTLVDASRAGGALDGAEADRVRAMLCALDHDITQSRSPYRLATAMTARGYLDSASNWPDSMEPWRRAYLATWPHRFRQALGLMPGRDDLGVGFMSSLFLSQNWSTLHDAAVLLLLRKPNSPVGLWFEGMVWTNSPNPQDIAKGLNLLRLALDLGIHNYLEIPPELENQIRTAP